jgi:glycine/D-amino acid oxidase-like deaminating enzyme
MSTGGVEYSPYGWIDPPDAHLPALRGDVHCDVVIVGGGYTGMTAALRLAERGADVALLEGDFCGCGASSRNAGHLTPTIGGDPQLLATVYRRRAPELVRVADSAVHFTEELIERLGIECDYEPNGNVSAALTKGQLRRAEGIARFLRDSGGDVDFVEGREWGLPEGFLGGILERAGGLLNAGKFAQGLRTALQETRAQIFEGTPALNIESTGGGVVVRAPGGQVHADRVLLATNAYSSQLRAAPRRVVAPVWVTLAETEVIEPGRLEATGWTSRSGLYTQHLILEDYRPTAQGTVLMGTRQVQRPRGPVGVRMPDSRVVTDLRRGFCDRFPSLRDVPFRRTWGGWIAMTPSWLPVAGEATPKVSYLVGYNGHGLAQAPYLGTLMADRLAGDDLHENLQVLWRPRPRFAPAPYFSAPALRLGWATDRATERFRRLRT